MNITVDYGAAMHELSAGGKNAWVSQQLHQSVPPESQQGIREVEFMLCVLDEDVEGLDSLQIILMVDGLRFATAAESVVFANHFSPPIGQGLTIHVLGSAFFNNPNEFPEEIGWFARQLKYFSDGTSDVWMESIIPRGGPLRWSAGETVLAVKF